MSGLLDEHYSYLSLHGRAQLYGEALAALVQPDTTLADLGCGFGALGLLALKAGAARAYGVEATESLEIARETTHRAGLSDRYNCISGSTFHVDLPEKVDLLLCDHVGWFGMDYGIIPMLEDARKRWLKDGGTIMPRRLRLYVAATSSAACRSKVDRWNAPVIAPEYHWLRSYEVNNKQGHCFTAEEICSAPILVSEIDLMADNPETIGSKITLEMDRDAQCVGMAGWFEAELADGIWMSNSPLADQRINRMQAFFAAAAPFAAKAGDQIGLSLRLSKAGDVIRWTISPPNGGKRQKLSNWNGTILGAGDLALQADTAPQAGPRAAASRAVLEMMDGTRPIAEIEELVLARHGDLFATEQAARDFTRQELARWRK